MTNPLIILPPPGTLKPTDAPQTIPAPSEEVFVATFGKLLPQASYIKTQRGKAAYYEFLPTTSPPSDVQKPISRVLFLHGIQTPAFGMQPLISALSSRFPYAHCVIPDWWGHGLSETPNETHNKELFHALVEALMERLGWANAHFVGFSLGARMTVSFAAARPELVTSMALVAPAGLIRKANLTEVQKGYLRGGAATEAEAYQGIIDLLDGGKLVVPSDWKERMERGEMVASALKDWQLKNHKGHWASVVAVFRDGGPLDSDADFVEAAKTGIKHICILGELDDLSTVQDFHSVGLHNVVVIPQGTHGIPRDRVPEVAGYVEDFWNKL
jgi:pimeloyl-ACP methyl ester carboxylesterase